MGLQVTEASASLDRDRAVQPTKVRCPNIGVGYALGLIPWQPQEPGPYPVATDPQPFPCLRLAAEVAFRYWLLLQPVRVVVWAWLSTLGFAMRIERTQLQAAAQRGIIRPFGLEESPECASLGSPLFSFNHLLCYLGRMVAIGGISTFVTLGWETLGGMASSSSPLP